MPKKPPGLQTHVIQSARRLNLAETPAVIAPMYLTTTWVTTPEEGVAMAGQTAPPKVYSRYGSPNHQQVAAVLAGLEGAPAALVVGSGMAAISAALLSKLKAGDHLVAQRTHYTATLTLLREVLPRYGIEVTQVDQTDARAFANAIRDNTRVIYTESPTNPTLALTDLRATARLARQAGALAIVDNTFASSHNQRPLEFGYDLVVHSATKYLNGHSDVTAGAVIGAKALVDRAWEYTRVNGGMLHAFDAWLLRRGLMTYGLRMAQHNANGLAVARFLEHHPQVERVYYPGLKSHPQHALARRQMRGGFGGMVAFDVRGGFKAAVRFIRRVELAYLAVSLGGVETLVTHAASLIFTRQSAAELKAAGIAPGLIRLSVGCEDAADIIADLDRALR